MMSDGRLFTDYKTATRRNEYIKYMNDIVRDDDYRLFLQENADKLMNNEWGYYKDKTGCWENGCIHIYPTRTIPQFFVPERNDFDAFFYPKERPALINRCKKYNDYRLTESKPKTVKMEAKK